MNTKPQPQPQPQPAKPAKSAKIPAKPSIAGATLSDRAKAAGRAASAQVKLVNNVSKTKNWKK